MDSTRTKKSHGAPGSPWHRVGLQNRIVLDIGSASDWMPSHIKLY